MSFLDKIKDVFGGILQKPADKFIGIDIGSSSIKIVQLSRNKGMPVLDTFGEISLSVFAGKPIGKPVNLPVDQLTTALKDVLEQSQADARTVGFSIPLKAALMFNLKIPKKVEKSRLDETVRIEARKYIPVKISEVQLDWSAIPSPFSVEQKKSYYDIIVIAIHKETLNKYVDIAAKLGLNLKFLEIETFSIIRSSVRYERDTTAIVDIGSALTKFFIVKNGIVRKSHIINIGSGNMLEIFKGESKDNNHLVQHNGLIAESVKLLREEIENNEKNIPLDLTRILNEIKKAIIAYQTENSEDISNVIFTGGGVIFEPVLPYIKNHLSIPAEVSNPFAKVQNPAFLDNALKETGPEFSIAVGLALRGLSD